jgi:hypothetical protein
LRIAPIEPGAGRDGVVVAVEDGVKIRRALRDAVRVREARVDRRKEIAVVDDAAIIGHRAIETTITEAAASGASTAIRKQNDGRQCDRRHHDRRTAKDHATPPGKRSPVYMTFSSAAGRGALFFVALDQPAALTWLV